MTSGHELLLATDMTRDAFTAELSFDGEQWAVVVEHDDATPLTLEVYGRPGGQPWSFPFEEAMQMLSRARSRLRPGPDAADTELGARDDRG